jgi:hypothetical protein
LIDSGHAEPSHLDTLLYGARLKTVDELTLVRVLDAIQQSGNVEAALGILTQWLEQNEPTQRVKASASALVLQAVTNEDRPMVEFYARAVVTANAIDESQLIPIWEARMEHRTGLADELDDLLTQRVVEAGEAGAEAVFRVIHGGATSFGRYSATELQLLSRLARQSSADSVWERIRAWPEDDLRWAVHHMDWGGATPDPLVRAFLVSDRLNDLRDEAFVSFFNTLGVVVGPFHIGLERELERAMGWRDGLLGTSAVAWVDELIGRYRSDIEWHKRRDEEEHLRLG